VSQRWTRLIAHGDGLRTIELIENMDFMATTISLDESVRDRLKGFLGAGMSYSEAIARLMDIVEADRFFASFRGAIEDPKGRWIPEGRMKWD
jgi:hypothetical protein